MNRFIENSGKRLGKSDYSVPASWKKGKTFLEVSLKESECTSDDKHFYFRCKCHYSFRKNDDPHVLQLAFVFYQEKLFNRDVHAWQGKQPTVTML